MPWRAWFVVTLLTLEGRLALSVSVLCVAAIAPVTNTHTITTAVRIRLFFILNFPFCFGVTNMTTLDSIHEVYASNNHLQAKLSGVPFWNYLLKSGFPFP